MILKIETDRGRLRRKTRLIDPRVISHKGEEADPQAIHTEVY